jgi:hypothetical protein
MELKGGAVRCRNFWGVIHAQYSLLPRPGGGACDCLHFECRRHADQRGGRKGSGGLLIVPPADEMEAMAAGAYEMLPRIRNRSLQLSLVSTVTQRPIAADARFDFVA